ncbi:hypothetical protein M8C21_022025 [Ambrosia artemisiifolia]|uniref:DUF4378 domain-containing protein n=1 Tax=Ambrosia artemisiifolia TaxID=4212 RepID=A0AAD5CJG9_AMBAR|nr:hypothetical protein M8C21_022025 [Ambrosia artemisiifolia]
MAAKAAYTGRDDKQELQKQLGCMNGIFHLLDRGYLLGPHRHWRRNQNRLTTGQGENGEKHLKKSSEKAKERNQNKMTIEKNRASVKSPRNSSSSSSGSSTTFSYFDCSKRVQTECQLSSEPTSPSLHKKQPEWSAGLPDIRDVVKDSMTRVIRVTKDERAGHVMTHVDSPRPFIQQNPIQYDRKDQNLAKCQKSSTGVKHVKEIPRFSCDERESKYSLKSSFKVNEHPRLSLDSKQNSKRNSMNELRSELRSNRPSSGIVARLMGLDGLTDSMCEAETLKVKPPFGDQLGERSPKMHSKIKPDLQQHESGDRGSKRPSVYGEMEKRLSALEVKTSRKDLKTFKKIVEAMQMTETAFEKNDQPGSPTVKGASSPKKIELLNRAVRPAKTATEPATVTSLYHINHKARKQVKDQTPRNNKVSGTRPRALEDLTPVSSPRLQRSKNGVDKQCFNGQSSDSSRMKKQTVLKTKHAKIKPANPMKNNDQPCMYSDGPRKQDVTQVSEAELAKLTMDQASPVSVLDAFYVEDTPSPVKKKPNTFTDYDNLRFDETEWNQEGIYNFTARIDASEFHQTELLNSTDGERAKSLCKSANKDHRYIREILSASGFLKDPDTAIRLSQLHSTGSMIKPELFHILEKTSDECHENNSRSKSNEKVRRKLIFDSVNDILFHKLVKSGFSGTRCVRFVDGEKLLNELWMEIDTLQSSSERCIYDEDDGTKILVSADLNKSSRDWDKYCNDVPGVVLDIERLIFKDLIDEIVNADAAGVQDRVARRCRRLFSM